MSSDIVQRVAMKAVIVRDGKVLILREAGTYDEGTQGGRYHLPGGRVDPGEYFEDALGREVRGETELDIDIQYPLYMGEWRPVIKGVPHQIIATYVVCTPTPAAGTVVLSDEHDDYQWIDPSEHHKFDLMAPEDKVIQRYADWANRFVNPTN
jgi:8-oxo-dGTP diphosphatase